MTATRPPIADRAAVCRRIERVGIVPVIRAAAPELALRAARAVMAGGISIFEITMTVPDAPAVIRALVAELVAHLPADESAAALLALSVTNLDSSLG